MRISNASSPLSISLTHDTSTLNCTWRHRGALRHRLNNQNHWRTKCCASKFASPTCETTKGHPQ